MTVRGSSAGAIYGPSAASLKAAKQVKKTQIIFTFLEATAAKIIFMPLRFEVNLKKPKERN